MFKENNLSNGSENLHTNPKTHVSVYNLDDPDDKKGFLEMGRRYVQESEVGCSKPLKMGSQELTLSYLCDNPKMGISVKEIPGKTVLGSFDKGRLKGKEVVLESPPDNNDMWVERDFMQLSQNKRSEKENSCRNDEIENNRCEKKAKIEALNLSLAPPDVSLSLTSLNPLQIQNPPKRSLSVPSWVQINNQSRATSDDIATSLSNSFSHQFSHNPSCSLTRNSTENYEYSIGSRRMENDQIWNCGEGTNGSVHSRFKPIGDSIIFSNHADHNSNLHQTTSSENHSFFPSELPARQRKDTHSVNSRGKGLANSRGRGLANSDKTPYQFIQEIVSDSVQVMARVLQEITTDTSDAAKQYLKNLLVEPDKREELVSLQRQLERRSDLTSETLSKCHKLQLDILVTVKTGIVSYISGETCLATAELVEIFLLLRCKNIKCKSLLPVDDCDCKICSTKKGFCSACMCPICMNFDFASNTCSWVGCDVCSHWFHASCSIQLNLIKPGPSSKGIAGTSEMQFNCLGCEHASELFGFVKEVFMCCAKDWGLETLMKELQCVRKIFQGSGDFKGKELYDKAEEMLGKLERKRISASDACNGILQFFKYGVSEFSAADNSSKELTEAAPSGPREETRHPPLISTYNINSSSIRTDTRHTTHQSNKLPLPAEKSLNLEMKFGLPKNDEFDSLETIIRIKEAEARMFQSKADDARTEAEGLKQLVRAKKEKLEEVYAEKFAKLCLQDAEERRRDKLEEVKVLENSHYDYCKMKMRMESEIAGLLERMEVAKQQ